MKKLTWKDWHFKYYPVDAEHVSKANAIAHSLQKWRGLRPETLAKYGLRTSCAKHAMDYALVIEADKTRTTTEFKFYCDDESCALCVHFSDDDEDLDGTCFRCPLFKVLGEKCDASHVGNVSPYTHWRRTGDPELMIIALQKALRVQRAKAKK